MSTHSNIENRLDLSSYPVDLSPFLMSEHWALDTTGVPKHVNPGGYHPSTIATFALVHWNLYCTTDNEKHRQIFLTQAYWLVEHESRIGDDAGGWPVSFPHPDVHGGGGCLSALTQGLALSVLVRAYQVTQEEKFLKVASCAARTFERDILDGGVCAPLGEDGIFFAEVAVYPATHTLRGFIFALLGLYDYGALTGDTVTKEVIQRSLKTMHLLLDVFDVGFWTRSDLLHRELASPSHLSLQAELLETLARYSGCDHCLTLASRWKDYQHLFSSRLRYFMSSRWSVFRHVLWSRVRTAFFPEPQPSHRIRICVPVPAHPFTGGILTVLNGIAQVTTDEWQLEYLAHNVLANPEKLVIHRFGTAKMGPWQFPNVWLYLLTGFWKLLSLLHHDAGYHLILPQDGVYTAALAGLVGKLAGVRVVCIDHGSLTLLESRMYRAERMKAMATQPWPHRLVSRLRYMWYWPSLYLLAWIAARFVDHYLVSGIAGDGVEEMCRHLGVAPSHITRFASMIEVHRHVIPDAASRAAIREKKGIAADAIVVAIICRLAPEKGLDIALASIDQALSTLSPDLRTRLRVIIAGDGPLRGQIEADICARGLSQTCLLWGKASEPEVLSLLGISDIFLYTSTRGACFAMAILEAMASGCAVIASTQPVSNAHLLAQERGIAIPAGDVEQTSMALVRLVNDLELCHQMGRMARDYVAEQHSPATFRRTLMRVTYWSALDEILAK